MRYVAPWALASPFWVQWQPQRGLGCHNQIGLRASRQGAEETYRSCYSTPTQWTGVFWFQGQVKSRDSGFQDLFQFVCQGSSYSKSRLIVSQHSPSKLSQRYTRRGNHESLTPMLQTTTEQAVRAKKTARIPGQATKDLLLPATMCESREGPRLAKERENWWRVSCREYMPRRQLIGNGWLQPNVPPILSASVLDRNQTPMTIRSTVGVCCRDLGVWDLWQAFSISSTAIAQTYMYRYGSIPESAS